MAMVPVGFLVILLTTGSFVSGADPNALADQILSNALEYILQNSSSWIKLPIINTNSTYYNYDASAVPFPTFELHNLFRKGDAHFETTDMGQTLVFSMTMDYLKTEYEVYSYDDDGPCNFVQSFLSQDDNLAVFRILSLPHFDGYCTGAVVNYQLVEFWSMEQANVVLCGEKSREMILKDMSDLHQPDIRGALQIFVPVAATVALNGVNMCP